MKKISAKKITVLSLMISVGIVLQIAEGMLSAFIIPGGKLGFANIATVWTLFYLGGGGSILVALLRSTLGCFLYGGVSAIPYSVGGAVISALFMWLFKKLFYPKLSEVGISVVGAFFHNLTQIIVASVIFGSLSLFSYLPVLTILGCIGGVISGYGAKIFCHKTGLIKR